MLSPKEYEAKRATLLGKLRFLGMEAPARAFRKPVRIAGWDTQIDKMTATAAEMYAAVCAKG